MHDKRNADWTSWALAALFPSLRQGFLSRLRAKAPAFSESAAPRLWLHAATRRDARLARLWVDELKAQAPAATLLFTSLTKDAHREFEGCDFVACRLLPFGRPELLRRLWMAVRPDALVLIENGLWPSLLALAQENAVPVFVANARFSANGPAALSPNACSQKPLLALPTYLARHDADWMALQEAGVPQEKLMVCGEMRIDLALRAARPRKTGEVPCLLGVGTSLDDERLLLEAYRGLAKGYPRLRLVLSPRAAKRARALGAFARAQGFTTEFCAYPVVPTARSAEVIVLENAACLAEHYALAQAAYVGGALENEQGPEELCEPVLHGVPVLCGPYVGEWRPFAQQLDEAGALSFVQDAADIARVAAICISQADDLAQVLRLGRARLCQHKGAAKRQAELILQGLPTAASSRPVAKNRA